jgi:iron complex transport system substrate-binding protein
MNTNLFQQPKQRKTKPDVRGLAPSIRFITAKAICSMKNIRSFYSLIVATLLISLLFRVPSAFSAFPLSIEDLSGKKITISEPPGRVVSLVPSVTEILLEIGTQGSLKAITHHSSGWPRAAGIPVVGGFFSPSLETIIKASPEIIFISSLHGEVIDHFSDTDCLLINLETRSIKESLENIRILGRMFEKENAAEKIVAENRAQIDVISKKIARIDPEHKKRVIRLMGRDRVMTPGSDSFQNEMIRAAGGIPPDFTNPGNVVAVSKDQWKKFNPQVIYGCGGDKDTADNFFSQEGWKDVNAVRDNTIYYFPCDLTCRAATHTGYFISWLASSIYGDEFSVNENQIFKERVFKSRTLDLDLDYVKNIKVLYSHIHDFINKTLVIDFHHPMTAVSTLDGQREKITSVGNHYTPPQNWKLAHDVSLESLKKETCRVTGRTAASSLFLFTGADMDNLSIQQETYKEMKVFALVTAGVSSNAMRMSKDVGLWYEPGTINVILLSNMKLTPRAMTRAIISATEAKTAALLDLDIRSSYNPNQYRATGTGTDNVLVVEGDGISIDNAGGHTKMGELMAMAVYKGVKEAIFKQNGIVAGRNVFLRLKERNITTFGLVDKKDCDCGKSANQFTESVERLLLIPRYAQFIESAFVLSDDFEKGLLNDLTAYDAWAKNVAEEIAGRGIDEMKDLVTADNIPAVLKTALNAILTGVYYQD